MVQVVAHDGFCVVQKVRGLLLALALERLLHQLDVVAPAGLDEDLLCGGALRGEWSVSTGLRRQGQPACSFVRIHRVRLQAPSCGWATARGELVCLQGGRSAQIKALGGIIGILRVSGTAPTASKYGCDVRRAVRCGRLDSRQTVQSVKLCRGVRFWVVSSCRCEHKRRSLSCADVTLWAPSRRRFRRWQ